MSSAAARDAQTILPAMVKNYFGSTAGIASVSVVVGVVVLALKYYAYHLTGSVALYSDAIESIVNVAASIGALLAIRYSALPADANHPYGHHKAEYFSVVAEGALIIVAAVLIIHEAYGAFLAPRTIEEPAVGLLFNGGASVLNGLWCAVLIGVGRKRRSPALVADGKHLLTDVLSSLGVLAGLILAIVTGIPILDPILAGLVALNILWSGWQLVRESVGGLMDEAVPAETLDKIRGIISANAVGAIEAHDVRTRHAGRRTFIDFHLVVPGTMPVSDAHDICDRIEKALLAEVVDTMVTIHVEPENKAKLQGVVVL
jgi:cation diffusion facilitator family transporter